MRQKLDGGVRFGVPTEAAAPIVIPIEGQRVEERGDAAGQQQEGPNTRVVAEQGGRKREVPEHDRTRNAVLDHIAATGRVYVWEGDGEGCSAHTFQASRRGAGGSA